MRARTPLDAAIAAAGVRDDELAAWCAESPTWARLFLEPARYLQTLADAK